MQIRPKCFIMSMRYLVDHHLIYIYIYTQNLNIPFKPKGHTAVSWQNHVLNFLQKITFYNKKLMEENFWVLRYQE